MTTRTTAGTGTGGMAGTGGTAGTGAGGAIPNITLAQFRQVLSTAVSGCTGWIFII